tara:strand:- start:2168 stop:3151 length:984 start_codon:yes stop_codon:yes gene_type:complete
MDGVYKQIEYKLNLLSEYGKDKKEVNEIMKDFQMLYTDVMININIKDKSELLERIVNENILDRMDKILETVKDTDALFQFKSIDIPMTIKYIQSNICDYCSEPMIQSYDKGVYECSSCNLTRETFNTLLNTSRSIPRSKIGNFNPERHFKTWIDRILAKESEDELRVTGIASGEVVIEKIKDGLVSRSKSIEHITIDDIRLILKELKITLLNKNTSLIAKKITGRSPPNLTDDQYMQVHSLFVLVMEARDKIDNINKCNRIYYPYYIAKILDLILVDKEQRKILHYIHLHKESTLSSNDVEWCDICNIVPQLDGKYRPTVPSTCRYI